MSALEFARYVALGDSMSIDLYPALDAGDTDVAVALERAPAAGNIAPIGAASLLYRNASERWPDEAGSDLISENPALTFENLATDAATIGDVFGDQIPRIAESDVPTLVTLTVGGNDLLSAFSTRPRRDILESIVNDIGEGYDFLVDFLRGRLPDSTLMVTTIYDPSDRTGRIPGVLEDVGKLPLDALDRLNDHIRVLAVGTPRVLLADAHARFLGHGVTAAESDRWYWRRSFVEPNAKGANELRKLWLETLNES